MASFVYTPRKTDLLNGNLDLAAADVRVALVMSNTTADTAQDANDLADITLDEYDGANYARQAIGTEAVNEDAANNRAEFDGDNIQFANLGAGTRQAVGMLVYIHVDGTAANDLALAYIDSGGFPFDGNGGNVDVAWNAEGILQLT
jgi:hypothetical protein